MKREIRIQRWVMLMLCCGAAALTAAMLLSRGWDTPHRVVASMCFMYPLHIVEECVFPGGYHFQYNLLWGSSQPDRAPMNARSEMLQDVLLELVFLVLMLLNSPRWALYAVLMTASFELTTHLALNIYARHAIKAASSFYGPGSVTCVCCFGTMVIAGFSWLSSNGITAVEALVGCAVCIVVRILMPLSLERIVKPKPEYVYASNGYYRFVEKVEE